MFMAKAVFDGRAIGLHDLERPNLARSCRFGGTGIPRHSAPDFHFFTEYNARSRRPSAMLVACNCPVPFEPDTTVEVLCFAERSGRPSTPDCRLL